MQAMQETQATSQAWHELNTWQAEEALAFYNATLGWEFENHDLADGTRYWIAMNENRPVGGVCELSGPAYHDIAPHWMTYLRVSNLENALANACKAGGKILRGPIDLGPIGTLAVLEDHTRALLGLIEPARTGPLYML